MASPTWPPGDIMIRPSTVFPADLSVWYQADKPWDSGFISLMRYCGALPRTPCSGNGIAAFSGTLSSWSGRQYDFPTA